MRIPHTYFEAVAFVFCNTLSGPKAIGSGFFVETVDNFDGAAIMSVYFVTARHVLEQAVSQLDAESVTLRINGKHNNIVELEVPIRAFMQNHQSGSMDITILPFEIDVENQAVTPIQLWSANSFIDINVGEGTQTLTIGLFHRILGANRNVPIVRTGHIAATPREPIRTAFGDAEMYIIESRSIGGLSGAPVIAVIPSYEDTMALSRSIGQITRQQLTSPHRPYFSLGSELRSSYTLIGLTHGHWDAVLSATDGGRVEVSKDEIVRINEGLSLVTPIDCFRRLRCDEHVQAELQNRAYRQLSKEQS